MPKAARHPETAAALTDGLPKPNCRPPKQTASCPSSSAPSGPLNFPETVRHPAAAAALTIPAKSKLSASKPNARCPSSSAPSGPLCLPETVTHPTAAAAAGSPRMVGRWQPPMCQRERRPRAEQSPAGEPHPIGPPRAKNVLPSILYSTSICSVR